MRLTEAPRCCAEGRGATAKIASPELYEAFIVECEEHARASPRVQTAAASRRTPQDAGRMGSIAPRICAGHSMLCPWKSRSNR